MTVALQRSFAASIRRSGAALGTLLFAMQGASAAPADPFIATIANLKRSIVPVVCVKPHPDNTGFTPVVDGTAFFTTRSGEFLTAAHVVRDFDTGGALQGCSMEVWFSRGATGPGHMGFEMFPVRRCISDNNVDLARCATDDLTKEPEAGTLPVPVEIDTSERPDGLAIAVTGYPLSSLLPITSRGYIGGYATDGRGASQIALDRAAWPGGSGSPVYDSQGKVLGLVTQAGEGMASGLSFARAGSTITRFLSTHPLPPSPPSPKANHK